MKVLLFAQSREAAGCDHLHLKSETPLTQSEFWALLIRERSALAAHRKTARLARREIYLQANEILQPGDEIAVIPPVSGG